MATAPHSGATVLVTGASRGIGLALAREYAAAGWQVLAAAREPEKAWALQALAREAPGVEVHPLDVTDLAGVASLAGALAGRGLDLLVNNAGVRPMEAYHLGSLDSEAFMESVRVNALGALKVAEAFLPHLEAAPSPLLVMMSSSLASLARNREGGDYAYRAGKAALNAVMRSLAADLKGRRITVISFNPGWVRTEMGGEQAPMTPEESARAIWRVLEGVGPQDTGKFLRYDGREERW